MEHEFGEYYESKKRPHIYVNTPKCASTTIKTVLAKHSYIKKKGFSDKHGYAIIRDPFTRYVSGLYEYWSRKICTPDFETWARSESHPVVYDEHTEHQWKFLEGFSNIELIPFEKTNELIVLLTGIPYEFKLNTSDVEKYYHLFDKEAIYNHYSKGLELYKKAQRSSI